jgi:hypothetical protein
MRLLITGLAALSFAAVSGVAMAQTTPAPSAPAPAAPAAAPGAPSVETTTIGDLIGNEASKAVLSKDMPKLLAYPGLDGIKGMTLRDISKYPEAELDDTKLAAIQKDLDSVKAP